MNGYSKDLFRDTHLESKFLCNHCLKVLKDPVQTFCGHRFCRKCLEQMLTSKDNIQCKACREEENLDSILSLEETNNDRAILRELNSRQVRCPKNGCDWSGLYKKYDQDHESSCPLALIKCLNTGCKTGIRRKDLAEHLLNDCVMRQVECQYCKAEISFKELKDHYSGCPKYPVKCQYCGREDIARAQLQSHVHPENGDCPKKMLPCKYQAVGCKEKVEEGKAKEHDKAFLGEHLLMLLQTLIPFLTMVQNMKDDDDDIEDVKKMVAEQDKKIESLTSGSLNLEKLVKQLQDESTQCLSGINGFSKDGLHASLEKVSKLVDDLSNKQTVLSTKVSTYEGIVAVLNNQIEKDAETVQRLDGQGKRDRELIESLERKIKAQDRIIALKDVALAEQDLRIQSLEMASYDGTLLWKIPNFAKKRQDAISGKTLSIYSPCCYTSRHGYKMCARIYLNGDGMGKGNHVSLFFVIMKGPFDALLRWPFRQKVTLMWLDQNNREDVIHDFRPDPSSSSFRRPTHDMNVASGCPLFMPLSQLDSPNHAYVKDDVAFVKFMVDTSDLA
ncbi:TNF receptor-associated factor 2-like isoform X2 [Glandiceps talaboti]